MVDTRSTINLRRCPAVKCRWTSPGKVTEVDLPAVHAQLEQAAQGRPYDYYHCGWCKRIWRIERYEPYREPYHEPQWIGYWDGESDLHVYKKPQEIMIDWLYRRRKADPSRPARNQRDAVGW